MGELEELVMSLNELMIDPHKRPQDVIDKLEEMGVVFQGEGNGWLYAPEQD